jgi:uroporphyrinogen decarboxylase
MIDLPDPTRDEFYAEAEEFARGKGDKALFYLTRGGLAPVMLSMGFDVFSLMLYDDPDLVKTMLGLYFDWVVEVAKRVNQLGFDAFVTADDCAFKGGLMFSPDTYRELVAPHYARMKEVLDIPWLFHSDGDISEVVPILIELGVTGVHPFENTAMDIRAAKKKFGGEICIIGNVDLNLLGAGTPEEVDREIYELIRDLAPGGGYIVCSGNSLAGYLQPENVLAYTGAVGKYGCYPIQLD